MGRPVVTLAGDRHANRVGVSLLHAIAHPEWIASDEQTYLQIASELVADPTLLAQHSRTLRASLQASLLMDHRTQATRFGTALRQLARAHQIPAAA